MASADRLVLTCEHGGNLIPSPYAPHFAGRCRLLHSHRGWDPGALELAGRLAANLRVPLTFSLISRLLVDLNRSLDNPGVFSNVSQGFAPTTRNAIVKRFYAPYRERVAREINSNASTRRTTIHLSIHTFAPVLRGQRRAAEIGVLYDPSRQLETQCARGLCEALRRCLPGLRVRHNYPYLGTDDGLTTALRKQFPDRLYAGIELEVNQRFPRRGGPGWERLQAGIVDSVRRAWLASHGRA